MKNIINKGILLVSIFIAISSFGQTNFTTDSTEIKLLEKPSLVIENLRNDDELSYPTDELEKGGFFGSILAFLVMIYQGFAELFSLSPQGADNLINFIYFLCVLILLFAVLKLSGRRFGWLFGKSDQQNSLPYSLENEDIHGIDYDAEIKAAVDNKEFRIAIRLVYLRGLKSLSDTDIIHWQQGKTDYDYLYEISNTELRDHFKTLSYHFNYVWYGHFEADMEVFQNAENEFNLIKSKIKDH